MEYPLRSHSEACSNHSTATAPYSYSTHEFLLACGLLVFSIKKNCKIPTLRKSLPKVPCAFGSHEDWGGTGYSPCALTVCIVTLLTEPSGKGQTTDF